MTQEYNKQQRHKNTKQE